LKLFKIGPCTVYAEDFKDPQKFYMKRCLVILNEGHKLELVATAVLGKGIDHANIFLLVFL